MGLDFLQVSTKSVKKGKDNYVTEVYPSFKAGITKDIMIRGKHLYAVWDEEKGFWVTDELHILPIIDREIKEVADRLSEKNPDEVIVPLYLWDTDNKQIDKWHKFCTKDMSDTFSPLDSKIIFNDVKTSRDNFATKCLPYHLEDIETPAYNELTSVLYSSDELAKIEWCIGAIFTGDSKTIQKFLVITGEPGSGKSTILKIMEQLFEGYWIPIDTKIVTSGSEFAMEQFQSNPLVAIEHDGNLSRIYDNSRLNSLVSHEEIRLNPKYKDSYSAKFDTFLVMASNLPVEITDAKSGLIRRIIDAEPTGNKLKETKYFKLMKQIKFELGGIAKHCIEVYSNNKEKYDHYKPERQIAKTYRFYDFIDYEFNEFSESEYITLSYAWSQYRKYVDMAGIKYPFDRVRFKSELQEFFKEFHERKRLPDGTQQRSVYIGFIKDKLVSKMEIEHDEDIPDWLKLNPYSYSVLDKELKDCPAQYANTAGTPMKFWDDVETTLKDVDPMELHYVRPPENYIVIDFDIRDPVTGEKSLKENIKAASSFPPTFAELSKSGQGLHLHYIWDGDVDKLSSIYDVNVEVKTFKGKSALRRRLSECNDLPIATISTGLPLKEEVKKVVNKEAVKNERNLRKLILRNLNKEIHDNTTQSIHFIDKILNEAYESGMHYDISDMYKVIETFASNSSNQSEHCMKVVSQMKFKSDEPSEELYSESDAPIIFFDVEVFPNLFIICHKPKGEGEVTKMINPTPEQIKPLLDCRLVGFNNRRYDNHILYAAAYAGYTNERLFKLSQRIIGGSQNAFFGEAYNLAYADIYEYSSKKQSLKKWEIELGLYHLENQYPWDQPLDKEHWDEVAEYCANDVIATEKVAEACHQDFVAREILAKLSGLSVSNTTRQHTTKIIFGDDKNPELVYTDLSKEFPGYTFDEHRNPSSDYLGEDPSEGGYVYAEPGIYFDVALLDVASLHPHSILWLNLFGEEYTKRYKDILDARIAIKHHDFDTARSMLNGALAEFLTDEEAADNLAQALKIVINSVYGYTTATFDNPFKDPRNVDNIVAKRGALFMMTLRREVQKMGYTVAHIKTDSIKIPNADKKIIDFCMEFGKKYGYTFEHEATYEKMCLVNDAVYIARYKDGKKAGKWTATGTQFQVPYVFKTLFSKEPIIFDDMCETKTVSTAIYLDFNEQLEEDEHDYKFVGRVGRFTPIKPGCGGALLLRENNGKYNAISGTKGYRWMESTTVKENGMEDMVDISYYAKLVDDARASIAEYGDVEEFIL